MQVIIEQVRETLDKLKLGLNTGVIDQYDYKDELNTLDSFLTEKIFYNTMITEDQAFRLSMLQNHIQSELFS